MNQVKEAYNDYVEMLKTETAQDRAFRLVQPTSLGGVTNSYTPDERIAWIKRLMYQETQGPNVKHRPREFHLETIKELEKLK